MIGAIAGDVLGSVYEKVVTKTSSFALYHRQSRPTDDSVLTLAVAKAILETDGSPTESDFASHLRDFGRRYPRAGYGGHFNRWLADDHMGSYGSWGNGSAMRSSPVGWAYDTVESVLRFAELTALPTHDHPEGIKGAQAVAVAVLLARKGASKEELRSEIGRCFSYDLDRSVEDIRPGYSFDVSCQGSVPEAIIAFLDSSDIESALRNAISLGGDADTQACIAGAIAEAFYGPLPASMLSWVVPRLDGPQLRVLRLFAERYTPENGVVDTIDELVGGRLGSQEHAQPEYQEIPYRILISNDTWNRLGAYARQVAEGRRTPGGRVAGEIEGRDAPLDPSRLLHALVNSKQPRIFAESEVKGDGSDWNQEELAILGDIGIAVPVTIYDDGRHSNPSVHPAPFAGTLLYVPGALLRADTGAIPIDWTEVVSGNAIDTVRYNRLYERRLLPALKYASATALARGKRAFVTIPGLGCGQFAGPFRGTMGSHLRGAIESILEEHHFSLSGIRAVWYDPYNECENARREIGSITLLVRPLLQNSPELSQLNPPTAYEESGDDFSNCDLFSVVAWDHVSWPGNDFYAGARSTDDGVKAAATDSMRTMTGFWGRYDYRSHSYLPPSDAGSWGRLVRQNALRIETEGNVIVANTQKVSDESE